MVEIKPPTTYDQQIALLRQRGCQILDEDLCRQKLVEIGYYRFSAYFFPFRAAGESGYRHGTSFERVYRIYEFDRRLRRILFAAVEEVEIYLRSQIAYYHAHKYGALGYLEAANFSAELRQEQYFKQLELEKRNNRNAPFVKHHLEKYEGHFPIWVMMELFTFGMLSRFYADMPLQDQKALARQCYRTVPGNIRSWLMCCNNLRNMCAHYGRLYNNVFTAMPRLPLTDEEKHSLWGAVRALRELYPPENADKWNNATLSELAALFEEYAADIDLSHICFPADWAEQLRKQPQAAK